MGVMPVAIRGVDEGDSWGRFCPCHHRG